MACFIMAYFANVMLLLFTITIFGGAQTISDKKL